MLGCVRPDWSHEGNDYCPCDDPETFVELYGEDCSECCYWKEDDD